MRQVFDERMAAPQQFRCGKAQYPRTEEWNHQLSCRTKVLRFAIERLHLQRKPVVECSHGAEDDAEQQYEAVIFLRQGVHDVKLEYRVDSQYTGTQEIRSKRCRHDRQEDRYGKILVHLFE